MCDLIAMTQFLQYGSGGQNRRLNQNKKLLPVGKFKGQKFEDLASGRLSIVKIK